MSPRALINRLYHFRGKQIIDCIDKIQTIADLSGYTVNVMDPAFNVGPIDNDPYRLNIRTDGNSVITSFTVG
jgi:hypothetical protein